MTSRQSLRWVPAAMVACALLAAPTPAAGQGIRSPYRYVDETQAGGLFAGYIRTDRGQIELGPASGLVFGGRYSIRLSGPFMVEAEAGYLSTSRYVVTLEPDTVAPDSVVSTLTRLRESDLSLLLLTASLRFNLTGPRTYYDFQPFLLAGGGAAIGLSDEDEGTDLEPDQRFDFGTSFAGHLGGGIEWFAMRRLALRLDARVLFWQLDGPRAFVEQSASVPSDEWVQNFYVSAGAAIHF